MSCAKWRSFPPTFSVLSRSACPTWSARRDVRSDNKKPRICGVFLNSKGTLKGGFFLRPSTLQLCVSELRELGVILREELLALVQQFVHRLLPCLLKLHLLLSCVQNCLAFFHSCLRFA